MNLKEMLLNEKIIKIKNKDEEPFILKSGKKSRLFIDIKEAILNPIILNEIVFKEILKGGTYTKIKSDYDLIASVAIGGIPISTLLCYLLQMKQIIVRSEKHDRGTKSQIIGNCEHKNLILIEDVSTSGGSIINAVKAIRDTGGICDVCIVVIDKEEGAKELCKENDIKLHSILNKSDFGLDEKI